MASFVEELIDDMVTEGLATEKATDIFIDALPDVSASTSIAVIDTGGDPSTGTPAPWLTVDVVVRASTYNLSRERQAEIYNRYHEAPSLTLTSYRIIAGKGTVVAASEGEDSRRRHMTRAAYRFRTVAIDQSEGGTTGYGGAKDPNVEIS